MDFKNFYKLMLEKKDHLIRKLVNLTDEQKSEIIDFFKKRNDLESKIDWNNKDLTYDDFKPLMSDRSKTEVKKAVKKGGIAGLVESKDYEEIDLGTDKVHAYIPLNYDASKLIASDSIGNCEGKWCTAYQKTNSYWNKYTSQDKVVLVYFIFETDFESKVALAIYPDNKTTEVFDTNDVSKRSEWLWDILEKNGVEDAKDKVMSQTLLFKRVRDYIKENNPLEQLSKDDIDDLARDLVRYIDSGLEDNEAAFLAARSVIDFEYESLGDYQQEASISSDDMRRFIEDKFGDWMDGYESILEYMKAFHAIDVDSKKNKNFALNYCSWASDERVQNNTDLQERLLELKWDTTLDESYADMMNRWINGEVIKTFDDIPEKEFIKWLEYQYENNHDEFIKCKENFVDDFDSGTFQTTGYKKTTQLTDEEKDYLNNLIDKVENKMYAKNKEQTKLKLK